jgi:hypothetical protein
MCGAKELSVGEIVDASVAERIAPNQPPCGQQGATDHSEFAYRLYSVCGAGRLVLAAARKRWADEALVEADWSQPEAPGQ